MNNSTLDLRQRLIRCFKLNIFKKNKWNLILFLSLFFSLSFSSFKAAAHTVTYTYNGCWSSTSGYGYSVDFTVAYAQSNSQYRWQYYENGWKCFVNGSNYIKGQYYNVQNSTGLNGIDFTNPNANLHGLSVRVIIRDGSDPCTYGLQYYGATITLNITGTVCAQTACGGNISVTNTTCGAHNGSLKANPSGASTYTYVWKNSSNTVLSYNQSIFNLAPGTYSVTITGNNGCTKTLSATVASSTGVSLAITKNNTTCGLSNGSATVNPSGANSYTYIWKNSSNVTIGYTKTIEHLASGTYNVYVTGDNGCTCNASVTINSSSEINVTIAKTHPTCGQSNGSITLDPSGSSTYTYDWRNSNNVQIGTAKIISNIALGTYTYKVIGSNQCVKQGSVELFSNQTSCNVTLSGNVYNDVNGLIGTPANTVDGSSTNLPSGLYASLVNGSTIVQTVPVTNGTYSFSNVSPNTTYSVVLSTNASGSTTPNLPSGWVNTGENLGTAAGNDGTVNGILSSISVVTSNVVNANLGIEFLPTPVGSQLNPQVNPGGTVSVTVPSTSFSGTDPDATLSGDVVSLVIKTLPTNATSITVGTTVYTSSNFPIGGIVVATNASGNPTETISLDPIDGAVTSVITFSVIDNAGKESATTATVTVPFTTLTLSGNVYNDVNGLIGTPVNTVDGIGINPSDKLYATLLVGTTIQQSVPVSTTGAYTFSNLLPGTYSVVIDTIAAGSTSSSLPIGWVNTGENLGTTTGNDGTIDGKLNDIIIANADVINANFGINRLPDGADVTLAPQQNPGGSVKVTVPASVFTGIDPEDGTYPNNLLGRVVVLSPGTNGLVYYNNVLVSANQTITNFDPTLVKFDPINGIVTGSFTYTVQDNAGFNDPIPNTIRLPFISIPNLVPRIAFDNAIVSSNDVNKTREIQVSVSNLRAFSSTNGLVTILVTKVPEFTSAVLNPLQTVNSIGQTLSNGLFTLDATSDPNNYIITTSAVLNGVSITRFAFMVDVLPVQDITYQIQVNIVPGSGGEDVFTDNIDDEQMRLILN